MENHLSLGSAGEGLEKNMYFFMKKVVDFTIFFQQETTSCRAPGARRKQRAYFLFTFFHIIWMYWSMFGQKKGKKKPPFYKFSRKFIFFLIFAIYRKSAAFMKEECKIEKMINFFFEIQFTLKFLRKSSWGSLFLIWSITGYPVGLEKKESST